LAKASASVSALAEAYFNFMARHSHDICTLAPAELLSNSWQIRQVSIDEGEHSADLEFAR
jgi:hypothetical protein